MRPHMLSPWLLCRQRHLWICNLTAFLIAKLLSKLYCTGRTTLHTFSAGDTFLFIHMGNVGWTWHIRSVKQLWSTQCITYIDITVTYGKNLVCPINICNLMYESVVFGLPEYIQRLFPWNVAAVLLCLNNIICHIAHSNAPSFRIVSTAFIVSQTWASAGARTGSVFAVVFIQPVWYVLQIYGFVFHLNRLFNRYYMHSDTCTALWHERCNFLQGQTWHMLKESSHLRIRLKNACIHIKEFCTPRHIHRQNILLFVGIILPVIFQNTFAGHLFQQCLAFLFFHSGNLYNFR